MDDYSDSSFQIPSSSSNFLLAEEDSDFLAGTDITFATPATLRRTRTRADDRLTLAELTPKPRTSHMPVRRSPRKHKATPAMPSPPKPAVESDLSAAMEDQPPPERSFQIPVLRDADAELLTADDSGEMFRAGGDGSFGDTPLARSLSQLTAPAQRAPAVIRSLPEEATPETSMPAVRGSSAAPARVEKSPATAPPSLVETGGDDRAQSRLPLAAPSVPFTSSAEARARTVSAPSDKMDCGVEPGEASSADAAEDAPMPVPALHRKLSNRRDSQVKTQSSAAPSGGNVKPSKLRSRPPSAASTKGLRRPRAAAVVMDDTPGVGPSVVSEVNEARAPAAAIPGGEPSTSGESGFAGDAPSADGQPAEGSAGVDQVPGTGELALSPRVRREPAAHTDALGARMDTREDSDEAPGADPAQDDDAMDVQPARPPSPMRRATKRAAPAADSGLAEAGPRKRGRTEPAPQTRAAAARAAKRSVRVLRSSRAPRAPQEPAPRAVVRLRGRTPSSGAAGQGGHLTASRVAGASASSSVAASQSGDPEVAHDAATRRQPGSSSSKSMAQSEGARHGDRPIAERLSASLPAAKHATKPVAFHFAADARIEARHGAGPSSDAHERVAIPDFAALHASHAHALAARRPAAAPTVPTARVLSTGVRAVERERFDAGRRAREAAAAAAREEERRAAAAAEAAEVRELRRRAVPRAHEVPAWYADMPKRAHDAAT